MFGKPKKKKKDKLKQFKQKRLLPSNTSLNRVFNENKHQTITNIKSSFLPVKEDLRPPSKRNKKILEKDNHSQLEGERDKKNNLFSKILRIDLFLKKKQNLKVKQLLSPKLRFSTKNQYINNLIKILSFKNFMICLLLFLVYLVFIDPYFLIKTYSLNIKDGSQLSILQSKEAIASLSTSRHSLIFPNNSFLLLSENGIESALKNQIDTIDSVKLVEKSWPNKVTLEIETKEVFATLHLKNLRQDLYITITKSGEYVAQDNSRERINLIHINSPINDAGYQVADIAEVEDLIQLPANQEKIHQALFLVETAKLYNFSVNSVILSSLNTIDTDIVLNVNQDLDLYFDLKSKTRNQIIQSFEYINSSEFRQNLVESKYIDLRMTEGLLYCSSQYCS